MTDFYFAIKLFGFAITIGVLLLALFIIAVVVVCINVKDYFKRKGR